MTCPQCGAATPDDEWNCTSCRINLYWASRHYPELARIRDAQGLATAAKTPSFLIKTHQTVRRKSNHADARSEAGESSTGFGG